MLVRLLVPALCACVVLGCGERGGPTDPPSPNPDRPSATVLEDPVDRVYATLREGATLSDGAAGSVEEARAALRAKTKTAQGQRREAMTEALAFVDQAGEAIVEHAVAPPSRDAVAADPAGFESRRLAAITALNDARHDLREARGLLEAIDPDSLITRLLATAIEDVEEAILAFGGRVEETGEATR